MGYTTEFRGAFTITPRLEPEVLNELFKLNETRHCQAGNQNREKWPELSLYCGWVPSKDGTALHWDGQEKFYRYVPWLRHIIVNHLIPKGYKLNGKVEWCGEDKFSDRGFITVVDNEIKLKGKPGA